MSIYWEEGGSFPFLILLKAFRYARKKLSDGGKKRIRLTTIVFYFWTIIHRLFSLFSLFILERRSHMVLAGNRVGYLSGQGGCCCRLFVQTVGKWRAPAILALFSSCVCVCLSLLYFLQVARRPNFIYYYSVRIDGTAADVYTDGRRTVRIPKRSRRRRQRRHVIELKIRENVGWCVWLEIFLRPVAVLFLKLISWETG